MKLADNEMLAEFIGIEIGDFKASGKYRLTNSPISLVTHSSHSVHLHFDVSWDWLMPVLKKCIDSFHDNRFNIFTSLRLIDIDLCWKAAVEFVKWYNNHKIYADNWKKEGLIEYGYELIPVW